MNAWPIPKMFAGRTVAVIAGGPSATPATIASARHLPRIVARNAYKFALDADVLLSLDADAMWFWRARSDGFRGSLLLTGNPAITNDDGSYRVEYIGLRYERVRVNASTEIEVRNSGLAAIRVAAEMGASEIALVGFDPDQPGYAPGYEPGIQKPGERPYGFMAEALRALMADLTAQGVAVRRVAIAVETAEIVATANDQPADVQADHPQPAEAATEESERPVRRRRERFVQPDEGTDGV